MRSFLYTLIILPIIAGCGGGGGGGGSSSGFYAGTWRFTGLAALNECPSIISIPSAIDVTLVVNQDGERVVVNTNKLVLEGVTVPEEDGFDVFGETFAENGCVTSFAYRFTDASDDRADVATVLNVRCGPVSCAVGYSGTAILDSSRSLELEGTEELEEIAELVGVQMVGVE